MHVLAMLSIVVVQPQVLVLASLGTRLGASHVDLHGLDCDWLL